MRSQCFRSNSLIILVLIRSQTGTALEDNIIKSRPFSVRGFWATRPKSPAIRVNTVEKVWGPFPIKCGLICIYWVIHQAKCRGNDFLKLTNISTKKQLSFTGFPSSLAILHYCKRHSEWPPCLYAVFYHFFLFLRKRKVGHISCQPSYVNETQEYYI